MLLFYVPLTHPSEPAKIKKERNENLKHFEKLIKKIYHTIHLWKVVQQVQCHD